MELREYLKIIKNNARLFFGIIILVITGSFLFFYWQPQSYDASILLNITRQGKDTSSDYKYDNFYRLQADEKFSETVVEWLKNPRITSDILSSAGFESAGIAFKPVKRSSQVIVVNFSAPTRKDTEKIAAALPKVVSQSTDDLNKDQKEENWFRILATEPVIGKHRPPYLKILTAAIFSGFFLAFFSVLIKHYGSKQANGENLH